MSTRYYKTGPNAAWCGVCEITPDGMQYIHHEHWPERDSHWNYIAIRLQAHLADGTWIPYYVYPAIVRLPDGM